MGHALPDCVGITKVGEDVSEYAYLEDHEHELLGAPAPGGWFTSRWLDDSGAMFVVSKHRDGYYNGSAHFNGTVTTTLGDLEWIEDTVYFTASVLDADGRQATRLCAAVGQFPYLMATDSDAVFDVVITGLVRDVTMYPSADAFEASQHGDKGLLQKPLMMPDGTTMDRLRFAVGSFIPTGIFGGTSPMASVSGEVDEAFAYTVHDTGATVHVARITALSCLTVYVCWPENLAPVPPVNSVIHVSAYLTAFVPAFWIRQVAT